MADTASRHPVADRNCKVKRLDPEACLRDVLNRIADHPIKRVDELLPWNVSRSLQTV